MTLDELRSGGKRALAEALARIETGLDSPGVAALLDQALAAPKGVSLGLTGPPGVGKSTLIDALIRAWRAEGWSIAVIAVDPSSARSGGALLGDRTRLTTDPADTGVFVRSMAARDQLGGVAEATFPAMVLMRALYDLVIVETVGVGQSEVAIAGLADMTVFCAQPGSGDALQYMKAGVIEIPDMVIVTKADMGALADRTVSDLRGALSLTEAGPIPVIPCAAVEGHGIARVLQEICTIAARFPPRYNELRREQVIRWAEHQILGRFGSQGLNLVHSRVVDNLGVSPFTCILDHASRLSAAMTEAFR